MARVLVVEDEEGIASFLENGLEAAGHTTFVATDGAQALALARDDAFDLVILDLGLPKMDGHSVLREVRARGDRLPIIVLTARDTLDSTLDSFAGGASDYMTKPFVFDELLARVAVRLNEATSRAETGEPTQLEVGPLTLDLQRRTMSAGGDPIELSAREFKLARVFFEHPGQVLSREQLLSRVWGYDFDPGSNIVDVYVGYLRKKLGRDHLETVRGVGYRLKQ
jgi:DNA-binding response OmpR family regulator